MKSFITALSVFFVMLAGIITHMVYANTVTDKLLSSVESESIVTEEGVKEAEAYWMKHHILIHLGVNTTYTDRITAEFTALKAAIEKQDENKIAESAALLRLYISELKKLNKLSLENIL